MSDTDGATPRPVDRVRTCIATRTRRPEHELLRVVARGEGETLRVVPDPRRRMPGRGAWLTPTLEAWEQAVKRRAFGRALKVSATADAEPVREHLLAVRASGDARAGGSPAGEMTEGRPEH
ncbi:YlxR family protein [Corynebacterium sp.]|uniref:YlxR family protein n=1 Tax=Corynebacterium sp. TaxID=1720 RepID=UPI0026DACF79|nr:YlxR family protein [Corynebacterium sp.]MDO4610875.1 YlxR family protein [Corynebacterium sp.]